MGALRQDALVFYHVVLGQDIGVHGPKGAGAGQRPCGNRERTN